MNNKIVQIVNDIKLNGGKCYIVGGFVRSKLLGFDNDQDIDFEVFQVDFQTLQNILQQYGNVQLTGNAFQVARVNIDGVEYEFSIARKESKQNKKYSGFDVEYPTDITEKEAAGRRDYTINSMYMTIDGEIVDEYGGLYDLENGILRHTSEAFKESPERILRGMQFAARLNFRIAEETEVIAKEMFNDYIYIEPDLLWKQWRKWALSDYPSAGLRFLNSSCWINHYPDLAKLRRCPQDNIWHPEGSVWMHVQYVVDAAANIATRDSLSEDERIVLLFAALLHDIGKPPTTTKENGRWHSHGHEIAGIKLSADFLKSIHVPQRYHDAIVELVAKHMRHTNNSITKRLVRNMRMEHTTIEQWQRIVEADMSGRPPLVGGVPDAVHQIVAMYKELDNTNELLPLVQGRHLITCGYTPGEHFGIVLRQTFAKQQESEEVTFVDLLAYACEQMDKLLN